jgi:predicted dithiol-disulfide oxidoreductase (DUF899 family)
MTYASGAERLRALRKQIAEVRREMREVQAGIEPQPVDDYVFSDSKGERRLSELFGDKDDLIVIHNMGVKCPNCTLWADGFNGIYHHMADRAAFVVSSPDPPDVQKRFAESRGWRFPMVSHAGTTFAQDMGYRSDTGAWRPGVSVFKRRAGAIVRVSDANFQPNDDFCALWHFLDLLPEGANNWTPKYFYS